LINVSDSEPNERRLQGPVGGKTAGNTGVSKKRAHKIEKNKKGERMGKPAEKNKEKQHVRRGKSCRSAHKVAIDPRSSEHLIEMRKTLRKGGGKNTVERRERIPETGRILTWD